MNPQSPELEAMGQMLMESMQRELALRTQLAALKRDAPPEAPERSSRVKGAAA